MLEGQHVSFTKNTKYVAFIISLMVLFHLQPPIFEQASPFSNLILHSYMMRRVS